MSTTKVIPDDDIADMQREEVHALEAIFEGALELQSGRQEDGDLDFPIVYHIGLNNIDVDSNDAEKYTDGSKNWPKQPLVVEVRYPRYYPSDEDDKDLSTSIPSFRLLHENTVLDFPSLVSENLLSVLRQTAEDERGMPSVLSCLYAAREFLDRDREWQHDNAIASFDQKCKITPPEETSPSFPNVMHYVCISTHHLLDHKPDNLLKTGHKYNMSGFYKYGTPGIAVGWGEIEDVEEFIDTLKRAMPQKKFESVFSRIWDSEKHHLIPTGWDCVDPPTLKEKLAKCGAPKEDYFLVLGLGMNDRNDADVGEGNPKGKRKANRK